MMTAFGYRRLTLRRWLLAGVFVLPVCGAAPVIAAPLQGDAFERATAAYDAINRSDLVTAEREARAAVAAQPDSADAARLLMDVLSRQGKRDVAIAMANGAVKRGAADADLYVARGFLHQAAGNVPAAAADFTKALSDPSLAADKQRTVRLALADAMAAQGKQQDVLDLLRPLADEKSYDVKAREGFAAFALNKFDQAVEAFAAASAAARTDEERRTAMQGRAQALAQGQGEAPIPVPPPTPAPDERLSRADAAAAQGRHQDVLDLLQPLAGEKSYDVKAREGFAAFALNKFDHAAEAFAIAGAAARSAEERRTAMKGQAQAEAGRGNAAQVRVLVQTLSTESPDCDLDLAYVLLRVQDDAGALKIFEGACAQKMTPASEMDAGYAAQRLVRNPDAIVHFSNALDKRRDSAAPFDPETEFGVRRTIDSLSRQFGLNIGAFYRADRSAAGGGSVGQGIAEGYWQPPVIGNRDGRILQLYTRLSMNALAPGASTVQSASTQAAFGVRYKPFADINFVGAAERLVPIGSTAVSDWLLRAGYSIGFNTDIQPTTQYNMSANLYGEIDYLTDQGRTIGSLEAKYGVDRRLLESTPNLTGSLYVNGAYNYDSAELKSSSGAIGPGLSLKYWFRESKNRAPASYVQMDVIYRFKVTPSDRASGLALQFSISF